jgi:methylated-DNA-[protein]-cysteine S-methyltransferase
MTLYIDETDTPIGRLAIVVDDVGQLHATGFTERHARMDRLLGIYSEDQAKALVPRRDPHGVTGAIQAYFDGDLHVIDSLRVVTDGTEFQRTVWRTLREIPCGETWSYGDLARRIGRPKAVRAVGLANGQNPVGVVVPCHRVIGSDGSLTGYGGGIERKRWLLAHERRDAQLSFVGAGAFAGE